MLLQIKANKVDSIISGVRLPSVIVLLASPIHILPTDSAGLR